MEMNLDRIFMDYLHRRARGRARAIPRATIERDLHVYLPRDMKDKDRFFRKMYSRLPIASCSQGLFVPQTPEEVHEFKEYMTKSWGPIRAAERVRVILAYYPHLSFSHGEQGSLPL